MPNRIIRDSCKTSHSLAAVSDLAERIFWRVVTLMDDFGRYHGSPKALMAACFPEGAYELTRRRFDHALLELVKQDMLRFYIVDDRRYVYSPTWPKFQRRRASGSKFPQPTDSKSGGHLSADDGHPRSNAAVIEDVDVVEVVDDLPPTPQRGARKMPDAYKAWKADPDFDVFWMAWPARRRKKRDDARKAWDQTRDLRPALESILNAVEAGKRSRDWRKNEGQYIPLPASWLRASGWQDLYEADVADDRLEI